MTTLLQRNGTRKSLAAKVLSFPGSSRRTQKRSAEEMTGLQIGSFSELGPKHSQNEDRSVFETFNPIDSPVLTGFVAVLDGHGGSQCSEYVSKVLGTHLREKFVNEESWENGEEVMREVFHNIDKEFCEIAKAKKNLSGSCATIVAMQDDEFILGNIGDCRAVLSPLNSNGGYGEPYDLTEDHRADSTSEELRIFQAGGEVKNGRILSLQPSRSFGDIDVKLQTNKDVVVATPFVDRIQVFTGSAAKYTNRPFMIIATDGVWDVLNSKQAIQAARGFLKKFGWNANICCEKLVELARTKGSTDDITVACVVW